MIIGLQIVLIYIIMAADVLTNSYIAMKWFEGAPQISPSVKLGCFVVNPVSVSISFVMATCFLMIGLLMNRRAK